MKKNLNLKAIFALLFAGCFAFAAVGCDNSNAESSSEVNESSEAADSETADQPVTESDPANMDYTLTYDSEVIPDGLAENVSTYFYAIETQNYDLYLAQLNGLYQEHMVQFLEENYGYGLETSLEQYHQSLVEHAGTDDFTITALTLLPASEALADQFEEGTDFVADYLETYTTVFGEDFTTQLQEEAKSIYDVAVTINGTDGDGQEITIFENMEVLIVETADGFGILG